MVSKIVKKTKMQGRFTDKLTYKSTPCPPTSSCVEFDDYDLCESNENITEKDLAVLLREEKLKLKAADKENTVAEVSQDLGLGRDKKDGKQTDKDLTKGGERDGNRTGDKNKAGDKDKAGDKNKAGDKDLNTTGVKAGDGGAEEEHVKKRICKKFITNPFYSNRLKISPNLPPPPPAPPPQYFPSVQEISRDRFDCQERRKRCKKKEYRRKGEKDGTDEGIENEEETNEGIENEEETNEGIENEEETNEGIENEEETKEEQQYVDGEHDGVADEKKNLEMEHWGIDSSGMRDGERSALGKKKKRCIKPSERLPCKKKVSEDSILLQPRQIPPVQRDLPSTSPKDILEREKLMKKLCNSISNAKRKCKKKQSGK